MYVRPFLTCQGTVHGDEKAVVLSGSGNDSGFVEDERADAGRRSAQGGVDDGPRDGDPVSGV